ncbi:MAG: beta-hydroxyacyl-ACP dehydratase [Xanthomonadales bacterium]|jgi:3-hydroxyacyl-[acyl-carrier-protein] dehydratase|nr:beta-hydroxyacyl-ACP dehydratase [Xanthomonadales bacterium]MDH3923168.1 beta-hydroxyacyl-ACP dehydratase [Xanthomonadales bacterium]MDH3941264.1 beta-hydroxyacyl-ACP dehydratase [Xanthomonadales bacterium]MDH4000277.1 beta-hydroxyacyl-ACP dehydratase [Xanthomonadales bacterium]
MLLEYFQMIDNIEQLDPDRGTILARADVPMESPVFEGHFPGSPLVPGVLLIETMAQASGFMLLSRLKFEKMPFLANVTGAKMRTFVEPGAVLMVNAELEHDGSGFAKTRAEISSDGKKICDSRIMFRIMPFPNETLKSNMLDRFSQISRLAAE